MSTIDDLNYARDPRNCKRDPERIYVFEDQADGGQLEWEIPTVWEVCPVCRGKGSHVNPAIDCGGLSEDFRDDPDFMDDYRRGDYDQPCNRCGGRSTVRVPDRDACEARLLALYDADEEAAYDAEAERLAEIRAGC
jgi:hypothetical protein